MSVNIDGLTKTTNVVNSLGFFRFNTVIPKGYEAIIEIDVISNGNTCNYNRTSLGVATLWNKAEFSYVIIDKDFNCVEDIYE